MQSGVERDQAILIPLFSFIRSIGLYGSIWGLVLVHTVYGIPITTLIFRNYYVEIPDALIEASSLEGAGFFAIYISLLALDQLEDLCAAGADAVHVPGDELHLPRAAIAPTLARQARSLAA